MDEGTVKNLSHDVGEALTKRYGQIGSNPADYYQTIRAAVRKFFKPEVNAAMPNLARVFTESDWDGFAGTESWATSLPPAHDCRPVIREFNHCVVVADSKGVQVMMEVDAEDLNFHFENLPGVVFPCQAAALAFLNGLPEDFEPSDYGFEE